MVEALDGRRALLAYAPHADTFGYSMPPPGLLRLGGALEREGIDVALEDLAYRLAAGEVDGGERLAVSCAERLIARGAFGVIGFSTMGATLPVSVAIAEVIHERGFTVYDDLVHGESQLPPIVRTREQYRGEPPNFTYREGQCYVIQPNVVTPDAMRGVQFGEMIRITATGVERLHTVPRQLFVCG